MRSANQLSSFSLCKSATQKDDGKGKKGEIVRLTEIQVDEVSLVPSGANEFDLILIKRKYALLKGAVAHKKFPKAAEDQAWDGDGAKVRLRAWASSDGSGDKETIDWAKFRTAFLWYDAEDAEDFGSYKMPVVDVFDGTAKVVWHGVTAAFAAVQGARGGVDIPEDDVDKVLSRLKKHYGEFGKEWPLDKQDDGANETSDYADVAFSGELNKSASVPIVEAEERLVTGVVLVPDKEDGQGDIITPDAVRNAAFDFLIRYKSGTAPVEVQKDGEKAGRLGVMHKHFDRRLELVESYICPADLVMNNRVVRKGSWVLTVKVLDDNTWKQVKQGKIRGFSLAGVGRGMHL